MVKLTGLHRLVSAGVMPSELAGDGRMSCVKSTIQCLPVFQSVTNLKLQQREIINMASSNDSKKT